MLIALTTDDLVEKLIEVAPTIAALAAVLFGGLIASAIARRVARWAVDRSGLEALAEKAGIAKFLYAVGIRKGLAQVAGTVVWWAGLLVTFATLSEMMGLSAVANGIAAIMAFLPRALAGLAVLVGGAALAGLLRKVAEGFGKKREDVEEPAVMGTLVYYAVLAVAVVMAARQAGLDTGLVDSLMTTVVAIVLAGVGLAFALGSRPSFNNLVAGHFFKRLARPGDRVRIGNTHGLVVRYVGVSVVIRTATGDLAVPCSALLDQPVGLERLGATKAEAPAPPTVEPPKPATE